MSHPVHDFLFEYYSFRPAYLMRWSPGFGVSLEGATAEGLDWRSWFQPVAGGWILPVDRFPVRRRAFVRWVIDCLDRTGSREPAFGCFGLHEWAMVYRKPEVRHRRFPLRLSREATDAVVEGSVVCCTHFDAFRFFSPAAVPRNRILLSRNATPVHDQPGCVHVTMDLYKWAYAVAPYIASELVADAFELAVAAREHDMRASPYDLRGLGFEPIAIETREGRDQYIEGQRELYRRAKPVRHRLADFYRRLELALQKSAEKNPIVSS